MLSVWFGCLSMLFAAAGGPQEAQASAAQDTSQPPAVQADAGKGKTAKLRAALKELPYKIVFESRRGDIAFHFRDSKKQKVHGYVFAPQLVDVHRLFTHVERKQDKTARTEHAL